MTEHRLSPIAVVDERSRLHIATAQDEGWNVRMIADQGSWPAWHPDGRSLAVSVIEPRTGESTIELLAVDGAHLSTVHRTVPGSPLVIAPGVPHYVSWSPGGTYLTYVSQAADGLDLVVTTPGGVLSERVAHGAPLFSSWSRDERFLAVHEGAELRLWEAESRQVLWSTPQAVGFRAPAFSGDGKCLLYAAPSPPGVVVMALDLVALTSSEVVRLPGAVFFLPRPASPDVAVGLSLHPESGLFDRLWPDVTATGSAPIRGPLVSATWSPTGELLAIVTPAQNGDGRHVFSAVTPSGQTAGVTEAILVSGPYRTMLMFFDQYIQSHLTWAPDGRTLLVAGRLPGDGPHGTLGDARNRVLAWRPARGELLRVVATGDAGFFAPVRQ